MLLLKLIYIYKLEKNLNEKENIAWSLCNDIMKNDVVLFNNNVLLAS